MDNEENEAGTRCVGAPIYDYRDRVIAALSLAWDVSAHPELTWEKVAVHVHQCAQDVSIKMGYPPKQIRQLKTVKI